MYEISEVNSKHVHKCKQLNRQALVILVAMLVSIHLTKHSKSLKKVMHIGNLKEIW